MFTQGSLYVQEWKNGTAEYVDFSDIHITCKYGWKSMDNGTTQVGTLTDVSLAQQSTHDFITIPGDSHTVEASWDDEQHMMESPVLYDVVFTVNNQKINKMSWNPTYNGWTTIGDCDTVDTGINNGYQVEILNHQADINVETQTDTKAWQTTEPYFGTGVITDGAYYNGNIYLIVDGTNHPGELSINETATWNSSDILKYSKQTSGIMFYAWDPANITQCSSLNHYTWDVSKVYLGYDNTTNLVIGGMTYTKQNPSPSYYEIKCQFNYGGSVRPAKTMIRWGTNEPYTQIIYSGVNPEAFSWQEQSVPDREIGTLVVEFVDSNNNGLLLDSFSSQDYTYDTDTAGSYGGTRLLIKSPDYSNIYDYSAGNFIECNITLADAPQPTTYTVTVITDQSVITATGGGTYNSGSSCTLTATVIDPMCEFDDWYDGSSTLSTSNPYTFTVTGNITVYGRWREAQPPQPSSAILTVTTNDCTLGEVCIGSGNYGCSDSRTVYDYENPVEIYAQAVDHDVFFDGWYVDGTYESDDNPYEAAVYEDRTYQAHFTQVAPPPTETYTVSVNVTGQGTVSGAGSYDERTTATLTAEPASGWVFDHWADNDDYQDYYDNPWEFTVYRDWNITAEFIENIPQYMIYTSVIGQGTITGNHSPYDEGDTATLTAVPASGWTFDHWSDGDDYQEYYDNPLELIVNRDRTIAARFRNTHPVVTYTVSVNVTGQGTVTGAGDYAEGDQVTLTATPSTGYVFSSWQINGTVVETNSTYQFIMGNQNVIITAVFEEEAEKHIYLCDNSGAHLAEMTKTGSTWNVTGSFTSGMYSIRATVENEYEDAWFKFYQTSGDNRVFVGAGDDPSFEDIGTYIMIDDILTSFSLTEDQTTNYYVVSYENTGAMTVSMVDNIVNSYIGDFVTASDISEMGYMTATDISAMGYMTQTDISSMSYITMTDVQGLGYIDQTSLSNMSYVDQTSLSAMGYVTAGEIPTPDLTNCVKYADLNVYAYVSQSALSGMSYIDNTYLSTYMNAVVGDINSILQTI